MQTISSDGWIAECDAATSPAAVLENLPLLASPGLLILPSVSASDGTLRSARTLNSNDMDMCEFLSLRTPSSPLVTTRIVFDMKRSSLQIFQSCATATICRTIRVLRHLPGGVVLQTVRILSGTLSYIDHIVTPVGDGPIDGSLYDSTFVLSVDDISNAYLGENISLDGGLREEAFESESRVARVRVSFSSTTTTNDTIHILSMNGPREALLALVNSVTPEYLVECHELFWSDLWFSRIDIDPKSSDVMTPNETIAFATDRFTIRRAMHDLHATGFMNGVDASGAAALGTLPIHVSFMASLFGTCFDEEQTSAYVGGDRLTPVPTVLGLKGSYLDSSWSDVFRSVDPVTRGMKLIPRSNKQRWDAFRKVRPLFGCMLAISLWDRYRVTQDDVWLRDTAFPIISSVAEFVSSLVIGGGNRLGSCDGFYASSPYTNHVAANAVLNAAIQGAITLGIAKDARERWTRHMDTLGSYTDIQDTTTTNTTTTATTNTTTASNTNTTTASNTITSNNALSVGDTLFPLLHPSLRAAPLTARPSSSIDANLLQILSSDLLQPHSYSGTDVEKRTQSRRRATDMVWLMWAYARVAQGTTPALIENFADTMNTFFNEFRGPWCKLCSPEVGPGTTTGPGTATGPGTTGPDIELGASFLLALAAGLLGVQVQGVVSENSVFSTTMGVEASYSGVYPLHWQSLNLLGMGREQRTQILAMNRLLVPTSSLNLEDIEPWSVSNLLFGR